jgi:hypothetical protein
MTFNSYMYVQAESTAVRGDYTNYDDYIDAYNAGGGEKRNLTIAGLYFGTSESNLVSHIHTHSHTLYVVLQQKRNKIKQISYFHCLLVKK